MAQQPFLIRFAHDPCVRDTREAEGDSEREPSEMRRPTVPDTRITKVDRETTDDR